MKAEEQLEQWVQGKPVHNHTKDECCPDFSCCRGNMADKETRERFAKAYREDDHDTIHKMLMMFLENAVQGKNVYVAGGPVEEQ